MRGTEITSHASESESRFTSGAVINNERNQRKIPIGKKIIELINTGAVCKKLSFQKTFKRSYKRVLVISRSKSWHM